MKSKNFLLSAFVLAAVAIASLASADDPKVTDRREKPVCTTVCETCYRCVADNNDPCYRTETYTCNCQQVCN